ncbi:MAG: biotin--[acetyl-CoA-carboxylase] ligase [Candidatus Hodarchaeales archaeon]|jgi:BirA family biotin operon repressor/biotin-[acetyl-CoA-carboxylase] ligase
MNANELQQELQDKLIHFSIIKHVKVFHSISSTHLYARDHQSKLIDGTAVIALEQTGGVGRGANYWFSPAGGLYMTVVFKPEEAFQRVFPFIAMISVSIVECFNNNGINCTLKWPNDVYYENKKISGVLASGVSAGKKIKALVLSTGVNLNNNISNITNLSEMATSYRDITGKTADFLGFISCILAKLDHLYLNGADEDLYSNYNGYLAFKDRQTEIITGNGIITGKVVKVGIKGLTVNINGEKVVIKTV